MMEKRTIRFFMNEEWIELSLTEDEATDYLRAFRKEFGWSGSEFSRIDAEVKLGRPMSDAEWEKVKATYAWERAMPSVLGEAAYDVVQEALAEAEL